MDQSDLLGLVRDVMKIAGAVLVAHGYTTSGTWEMYTGIAVAIVPVVWSFIQRAQVKVAIKKAAATGIPAQPGISDSVTFSQRSAP